MSAKEIPEELRLVVIPDRKVFLREYFVHQIVVPCQLILPEETEFTFPLNKEHIIDDIIIPKSYNVKKRVNELIQSRNSQDNVPINNNKKAKKVDTKKKIRQQLAKLQKCMNTSGVSEFDKNDNIKVDSLDCSNTIDDMDILDVSRDLRLQKKRGRKTRFPLRLLPSLK
jgi:hypothetical protein